MITARIDTSDLRALVDRATQGASSAFFAAARPVADRIVGDARPIWPVRTGASRDAFQVEERIAPDRLAVVIRNEATARGGGRPYAYLIRYSRLTVAQVQAKIAGYGAKATTAEGKAAALAFGRRVVARVHGAGAPPGFTGLQPWRVLVKDPADRLAPGIADAAQATLTAARGR